MMAQHIDSIATCSLPKVTRSQFYKELRGGDLIFCSGRETISRGIELVTASPFSHVLMIWTIDGGKQWLTLESTIAKGVHVGLLADYVDGYNGDLVLARRTSLSYDAIVAQLNKGFEVLDDTYDWQQEVSIVARKLLSFLPVQQPKHEFYCSGLQYFMSLASGTPLQKPGANYPTPEDNFTDPSVEALYVLPYKAGA